MVSWHRENELRSCHLPVPHLLLSLETKWEAWSEIFRFRGFQFAVGLHPNWWPIEGLIFISFSFYTVYTAGPKNYRACGEREWRERDQEWKERGIRKVKEDILSHWVIIEHRGKTHAQVWLWYQDLPWSFILMIKDKWVCVLKIFCSEILH